MRFTMSMIITMLMVNRRDVKVKFESRLRKELAARQRWVARLSPAACKSLAIVLNLDHNV
jgi:hypothetical protein